MHSTNKVIIGLCTAFVAMTSAAVVTAQVNKGVERAPWVPDVGGGKY